MNHHSRPTRRPAIFTSVAGALVLPFALIAGLLSFPTTCTCGAELPHEHALFALQHHIHGHEVHEPSGQHPSVEAETHGISVESSSTSASGKVQVATFSSNAAPRTGRLILVATTTTGTWTGMTTSPESPPPQA